MKMTTGKIALIVALAFLLILVFVSIGSYNGLVRARTNVEEQAAEIDNQLQRRMDLIPNLVETVKGYAAHEKEIIQSIADSRAMMAGARTMSEKAQAGDYFYSAFSRLLMVQENYPQLAADQHFKELRDELAGTENRIAVARRNYNNAVANYNNRIQTFPSNIFAGMFGFEKAEHFEAAPEAHTAPTVSFGGNTTTATTAAAAQ